MQLIALIANSSITVSKREQGNKTELDLWTKEKLWMKNTYARL